jgi:hypothetical protein
MWSAPRFTPPDVDEGHFELRSVRLSETLSIDLIFKSPRIDRHFSPFVPAQSSSDLADFLVECLDFSSEVTALQSTVSEDLFVPLGRTRQDGKAYQSERSALDDMGTLFPDGGPVSKDKDGFRKSFKETPSRTGATRMTMTIWDLILPLLQAPLLLEFPLLLDLPSPLYDYQRDGVRFLAERESALLADDMGTGKTVQTIVALRMLFQSGRIASALIVAPLVLLKNWDRELEKWATVLTGVTVVRGSRPQREIQWEKAAHVWIASYGTVREDIDHITKHRRFDVVILDEAQAIKNRKSEQSKAAKRVVRTRAWALSGTPIENGLDDLVSIFEFLKPGLLNRQTVTPESAKQTIHGKYFLRRRKQDVLKDLPPKTVAEDWVGLEDAQREAYERAEQEGRVWLEKLGAEASIQNVLDLIVKLKMLCNREPKSAQSCKLDLMDERLEEVMGVPGSKALIFSNFKSEGVDLIVERYAQFHPIRITGDVGDNERHRLVDKFQSDSETRLLVATPKSGGVGINLTAANYVFHFDHWWNPATEQQAEDRAHRIGQMRQVFVYHIWTENTIEERIYKKLEAKRRLYSVVIDDLSTVAGTPFTEDEWFEVFGLQSPRGDIGKQKETPKTTRDALLALSPTEFEGVIGKLYESMGYAVRVGPGSRDGGVDLIASAVSEGIGTQKLAIQCKRYDPVRTVGVVEVRELLGVVERERSFTKGILVTTAAFSLDALRFASGQGRLELRDGQTLSRLIELHGLQVVADSA